MLASVVTINAEPRTIVIFFVKLYATPPAKKNNKIALNSEYIIFPNSDNKAIDATIYKLNLLVVNL